MRNVTGGKKRRRNKGGDIGREERRRNEGGI